MFAQNPHSTCRSTEPFSRGPYFLQANQELWWQTPTIAAIQTFATHLDNENLTKQLDTTGLKMTEKN
jgi:hypothetical protein